MLDQTDPLELLAQDSLVPVHFRFGATGLGNSLDPGCHDVDVQAESNIDIPLWMVQPLAKRSMVAVKTPTIYGDRYRRKLNAGAECVSLKNRAPFFYEVGNKINEFLRDAELSGFLSKTFQTRYYELLSKGLNTMTGQEVLELYSKLSNEELQLFEGGRLSIMETDRWLRAEVKTDAPRYSGAFRRKRSADNIPASDQDNKQQKS